MYQMMNIEYTAVIKFLTIEGLHLKLLKKDWMAHTAEVYLHIL